MSHSKWTEKITTQRVIARVISKSVERQAQGRFEMGEGLLKPFPLPVLGLCLRYIILSYLYVDKALQGTAKFKTQHFIPVKILIRRNVLDEISSSHC